ncbi:TIGR03086 family metal-binding protein, partial [Pseudonocardia sp. KRD291]|uniref:TIGR03086 family metal-binding protein n=1 Tax=Pseudonocardia sp. KRD291 TaxID=2792007 RepID=UPI001C5C0971
MPETTTPAIDLTPTARAVAALVRAVRDDQLDAPTPCLDMTVATLLDHLHGLAGAFRDAAAKSVPPGGSQAPRPSAEDLVADWRESVPAVLDELAAAWTDPGAWEGMTEAGGLELPGGIAGVVALDEIVLHGWDLAAATGQDFRPDDAAVAVCLEFTGSMSGPGQEESRQGLFGPVVPVPDDSPTL